MRRLSQAGGRDQASLLQIVEDLLRGLLRGLGFGVDHQLRIRRRLVGVGDAGELLDLPGPGLRIEALDVAPLALLHRGLDVRLDEAAVHLRSRLVPDLAIRRDRSRDHGNLVARQQIGDESHPADVRVPVLLREPEPLGEVLANDVAVEDLELRAAPPQLPDQQVRDRRLAGPRKPGEPEAEAGLISHYSDSFLYASIRIFATSSRVNSCGGVSPRESISRTLVPDKDRRASLGGGQVLPEAMPSHALHQKVCSKNSGSMPSSPRSIRSKMRCAS